MNKTRIWPAVWLTMALLVRGASAMDLTAVTLFGCNGRGVVDTSFRTNSGPQVFHHTVCRAEPELPDCTHPAHHCWARQQCHPAAQAVDDQGAAGLHARV